MSVETELPLDDESEQIEPENQLPATVMIVDDTADNLKILRTVLSHNGFQVVEATNGSEALALLQLAQPDVILLDVVMPDLDGYEVVRRIRAMDHLPYTPIVMLTSLQDNKAKLTSLEVGADDFLSKPFSQPELLARTRSLVRLRRSNVALRQSLEDNRYLNDLLTTENTRMAQELERTRQAQMRLMPHAAPGYFGVSFAVHYKPALEVGGDYYDYIKLDDHRFVIMMGDAVGKGGAAVLSVAIIKSLVAAETAYFVNNHTNFDPARFLQRINNTICGPLQDSETEMTLFCGLVDLENRRLTFANAGQTFPYLTRPGEIQEVRMPGLPIGLFDDAEYHTAQIEFRPGDRLALYSDGINEATSIDDEQFGLDRLAATLLKTADLSPELMLSHLILELNQFCADAPDDQTLVIFGF